MSYPTKLKLPVEYEIPVRTQSEANLREHWAKRHRRSSEQRTAARVFSQQWFEGRGSFAGPITVTLTRVAPRTLDSDNLARSMKAVRDGIADSLGVDDKDTARLQWRYDQRKQPKTYSVEVKIEPTHTY